VCQYYKLSGVYFWKMCFTEPLLFVVYVTEIMWCVLLFSCIMPIFNVEFLYKFCFTINLIDLHVTV